MNKSVIISGVGRSEHGRVGVNLNEMHLRALLETDRQRCVCVYVCDKLGNITSYLSGL